MDDNVGMLAGEWDFDPAHTRIGFSARHAMVTSVRGAFNEVTGHLVVDPEDLSASSAHVVVQVASIDTRNSQRDAHLRSADFFDVDVWPTIEFTSTAIEEVEDSAYAVTGDLRIRDITRQVMIPVTLIGVHRDATGALRAGFEGSRRLNRRDFGLEWNVALDTGGVLVSERISLELEISAVKREDSAQ
ncbi:YceI family protein [Serinibacter salmoneus]|uniref:Polyisoprenoid-binding protein YceI n=1 Tax=Serinibacter salmoneus TaxID=556530 RepID=A0A2A9D2E8_9MICO|nr:YceI family protein [Serinibacter salmoneus]PFG20551.1 polyisoprenoid-binding protein YceI [Serinibacter salmoneus]